MEDDDSLLLGKVGIASPSFSWAWHSSAQACFLLFFYNFGIFHAIQLSNPRASINSLKKSLITGIFSFLGHNYSVWVPFLKSLLQPFSLQELISGYWQNRLDLIQLHYVPFLLVDWCPLGVASLAVYVDQWAPYRVSHIDKMPNMVLSVATLYWQKWYSVWIIHTLATYDTKCFQLNLPHIVSHILYMWHDTPCNIHIY